MSNNTNNNGWTEERRKKQSEAIRRWKPWEQSTGPKTAAGKERSAMNAYKHGARCREALDAYRELLRMNREFVQKVLCINMLKREMFRKTNGVLGHLRKPGKINRV